MCEKNETSMHMRPSRCDSRTRISLSRARPSFALPNELSDELNMRNISSTETSSRALLNIINRDIICHIDNALLMLIISQHVPPVSFAALFPSRFFSLYFYLRSSPISHIVMIERTTRTVNRQSKKKREGKLRYL